MEEKKIKVLDHGFVKLIDFMGSDSAIVQAARVSYGEGTKSVSDDRKLIRYMMRNSHSGPFEMVEVKLEVMVPNYIWKQWLRHRTASISEVSSRYSIVVDSTQKTNPSEWRSQDKINKQSSSGKISNEIGIFLSGKEKELLDLSRDIYANRLTMGVAREQARKDLPMSVYTNAIWKIDLHNLMHFLELRLSEHAQLEIREYAKAILSIVEDLFPLTIEAFKDYRLNKVTLSAQEQIIILHLVCGRNTAKPDYVFLREKLLEIGFISEKDGKYKKSNEFIELEKKLELMGLDSILRVACNWPECE